MNKLSLNKLEEYFLITGFFTLILLVFSQFLFRYVFDFSVSWTQEASRYLLIWIAWISVPYAIKDDRHIRVEIIKNMVPQKLYKIIDLLALISWILFAAFLAYIGTQFVLNIKGSGQNSPMIGMPMWIVYLILPITGLLILFRTWQKIVVIFRTTDRQEDIL